MSEGKAVRDVEFTDASLLLTCMRDAIRGHRSLLEKANILHRDISCNNIMLATSPRSDGFKGFLIDLDLAILLHTEHGYEHRRSGAPKRTGTFEFMSVDMLLGSPDFQHCYYDDLQSFIFVLIYLCTKAGDHRNELLSVWGGGMCAESAGRIKHSDMTKDQCFEKLLSRFKPELGKPVCEVVDRFRRILFPSGSEFNRRVLADETVRRKMYDDVLAVFDAKVEAAAEVAA
jgi:serine/threonine protein kinase